MMRKRVEVVEVGGRIDTERYSVSMELFFINLI